MQNTPTTPASNANKRTALQNARDDAFIGSAQHLPINASNPVIPVTPITTSNAQLPIILLFHGGGPLSHLPSLNGYGPLAYFWAAHGFVVIQPTHLSSRTLNFDPATTPGASAFWRSRVEDMKLILDQLEHIESSVPSLKGQLDSTRFAVVGHSMGGHTAGMLLGATLTDEDGSIVDNSEPRIKAGVLLGAPGNGGDHLTLIVVENYPFMKHPSFAEMKTPTLVVIGEIDESAFLTTRGASWHADPFHSSSGPKSLLTLVGGKHGFGGVAGYDAKETDDESNERLAAVQRLTWAYLRSELYPEDKAWSEACAALEG